MAFEFSNIDLTLAALLNAGGGVLHLLLGAFVLSRRPHRPRNVWLGLYLALEGIGFIFFDLYSNPATYVPAVIVFGVTIVTSLCIVVGLLLRDVARSLPRSGRIAAYAVAAFGCIVAVVVFFIAMAHRAEVGRFDGVPPESFALEVVSNSLFGVLWSLVAGLVVAAAETLRASRLDPRASHPLLMATPMAFFGIGNLAFGLVILARFQALPPLLASSQLATVGLSIFWLLRAMRGPNAATARNIFLALLATMVLLAVSTPRVSGPSSVFGVLFILWNLPLAYGIFRLDLLGVPLPKRSINFGFVAAVALATLFIGSQLAQTFLPGLGDSYKVAIGGTAAGLSLVAPLALQRAAERKKHTIGGPLDHYRSLVELAWSDGKMRPKERVMLNRSRDHLGIRPADAQSIEDDVVSSGHEPRAKSGRHRAAVIRRGA